MNYRKCRRLKDEIIGNAKYKKRILVFKCRFIFMNIIGIINILENKHIYRKLFWSATGLFACF